MKTEASIRPANVFRLSFGEIAFMVGASHLKTNNCLIKIRMMPYVTNSILNVSTTMINSNLLVT